MRVCLTDHVQSPAPINVECTWPEMVTLFRAEAGLLRGTAKEDQRMISFGHFTGPVGNTTLADDGLHAIALDFDDVPDTAFRAAVELAQTLSTEGLAHTTFSHGARETPEGTTRGRIVIPFSAPIQAYQWPVTWDGFERAFRDFAQATCDPVCKNVGRRYWLPSINAKAAPPFDKGPWILAWGA